MSRLVMLFAVVAASHVVLEAGPARAADDGFSSDLSGDVRGMIVFKLPFGGPKVSSTPRWGFDLQMNRRGDYEDLEDTYDPRTGRRLPSIDPGGMRTWTIDPGDVIFPDAAPDRPDSDGRRSKRLKLG